VAKKTKPSKYQEGAIRGKKVFLLGALPVLIFLGFMAVIALIFTNFANKMSVNKDNGVCNTVRRLYAGSIQAEWPCDLADRGDYYLVTFNQSANTGQIATLMSFKYFKSTKIVEPAISIK
jgi:hypothetical protein